MRENRPVWADHDKHFGPFTFSKSDKRGKLYRYFSLSYETNGDEDDDYGFNRVVLTAGRYHLIVWLPQILKPKSVTRVGHNGVPYTTEYAREYGMSITTEAIHGRFGVQRVVWLWESINPFASVYVGKANVGHPIVYRLRRKQDDVCVEAVVQETEYRYTRMPNIPFIRDWFAKSFYSYGISFSDEVGDGVGSYKGGVLATSFGKSHGLDYDLTRVLTKYDLTLVERVQQ